MGYRILADLVLIVHAAFVAFVVLGLALILVGGARRWSWVRGFWFRVAHLLAIVIVAAQAWGGILCPLTTLESRLRRVAGQAEYTDSFVAHWLGAVLFVEAEPWVFTLAYTVFGGLVVVAWILVRPRGPGRHRGIKRRCR